MPVAPPDLQGLVCAVAAAVPSFPGAGDLPLAELGLDSLAQLEALLAAEDYLGIIVDELKVDIRNLSLSDIYDMSTDGGLDSVS